MPQRESIKFVPQLFVARPGETTGQQRPSLPLWTKKVSNHRTVPCSIDRNIALIAEEVRSNDAIG